MKLTSEQVRHIAKLARINLPDEKVEKFTLQLGEIINFVEELNELDTENVPETNQITGLKNILREDEVVNFENPERILACSNNPIEEHQIKVKKSI